MCCLCFGRFEISELNVVEGIPEDVCIPCAEEEKEEMRKRGLL